MKSMWAGEGSQQGGGRCEQAFMRTPRAEACQTRRKAERGQEN